MAYSTMGEPSASNEPSAPAGLILDQKTSIVNNYDEMDEIDNSKPMYCINTYVRTLNKSTNKWSNDIYIVAEINKQRRTHKLIGPDDRELKGWYKYESLKRQIIPGKKDLCSRYPNCYIAMAMILAALLMLPIILGVELAKCKNS